MRSLYGVDMQILNHIAFREIYEFWHNYIVFPFLCAVLEEQKAGVQKEASDLRHSLREVEKARLDARRELQDLRRQVREQFGISS